MSDKLIRPVVNAKVTSPYGWRVLNGQSQFHPGIDYINADDTGDPWSGNRNVLAIFDGTCVADNDAYDASQRYNGQSKHSLGNYIYLQHKINGVTYFALYAHLKNNNFNPGDKVKQGDVLGPYSNYGWSFGSHCHFQLFDINWQTVDPTQIILTGVAQ